MNDTNPVIPEPDENKGEPALLPENVPSDLFLNEDIASDENTPPVPPESQNTDSDNSTPPVPPESQNTGSDNNTPPVPPESQNTGSDNNTPPLPPFNIKRVFAIISVGMVVILILWWLLLTRTDVGTKILMDAVAKQDMERIDLLLDVGVDINKTDSSGDTPLIKSMGYG